MRLIGVFDMWANFGPVVQVKHLTLDPKRASQIVDQVESDCIVVVCRDADAPVIQIIASQIGWGRRVRGIITESDLIAWYDRCLRGPFAQRLAAPLLTRLTAGFKAEFPQSDGITGFMEERHYLSLVPPLLWHTETDDLFSTTQVEKPSKVFKLIDCNTADLIGCLKCYCHNVTQHQFASDFWRFFAAHISMRSVVSIFVRRMIDIL